ncbi:MAG TPA: hypothetical protein VMZ91_13170 [Candidatus Paceibacterota bacterium]|nr:hypothetical protein [Candidatus Paceibacterota bacterium]
MRRYNQRDVVPSQDTGWGLIFRLNDLLRDIENLAVLGKYDEWNFKLDRIWANLSYREDVEVKKEKEEIIEIKLKDDDFKEKDFLDLKILEAKRKMREMRRINPESYKSNKDYIKWKNEIYQRLLIKDIWVRKLMRKLNLYMKEIKHSPAGAMFGR